MKKKIFFIIIATLMLTIMLGTLVACVSGNSNTGSSNVPTPTPITPDDDGGQDDPDITPPGTDDPVDPPVNDDPVVTPPETDDPVDPPITDDPVDPVDPPVIEKTEAEYKAECTDLLEEIALTALNNSNDLWDFSNVKLVAVNAATGTIYCYADAQLFSAKGTAFYIIETNQAITESSFEEALETLESFDANSITEVEAQSILEGQVSEEMYNKLVEYVLSKVNLEGANVLNVTKFAPVDGKIKANFIVELNNIIYDVQIKGSSAESLDEKIAEELLSKSSTTYSVISEENFLSFDSIGEAQ